ncbi:M3 family oligoendopeptidase [Paenibacillus melissococcoides]|uniref:M3 family oligoendopeptidase n=1 Tax=Paenibacillus melissococcoides TaxID=2912268 RepID=A0ABN8TYT3_9BACL|nr:MULTISPECIES: M3 family oligoendopeptidase [Paenibacillus]MEB9894272.1 M3 family oligoendopeptidase [Bacillus cereus]CAH8243931.1 M3 family oligoendopeptidase [Paenibacillus melissococcoides]CAH8704186.1 M3 family oligoendopeptidase [Paenibacillus melissococcoides]CAH8706941.1 M3 family oligoendopeptidase [Paenibacillus melissococcoides]GIO80139.1 oligoendopeptidase F [Paenibacillus dendritiformis]
MTFSEYRYERPDIAAIGKQFKEHLQAFNAAESFEEQNRSMEAINKLRSVFDTQSQLVAIRHSIDTNDEFYKAEQDYMDEITPMFQEYITDYYKALIGSKFRVELEQKWGRQLFRLAELSVKTFHPDIIEDLQQENKLATEYNKLIASAKIPFEGEERTLAQLMPFEQSPDRDMRRRASEARYQFMAEHEAELDRIYDELVKVRTKMARKLGFSNFVELGYARMCRTDYNAEMVANFRKQVLDEIVPIATKLRERQRNRIGVDTLRFYDEGLSFKTGNATPKGGPDWIIANGKKMYAELSPEMNEFFTFMVDNGLMDLVSKKGKQSGGYCTYLSEYGAPFIFSNFNGTSGDIDVLTHEAGHAFQVYESRHLKVPEYHFPTFEAAEIHSMSMEFFTWPWMNLFFEEETEKYKFDHLSSGLLFLPYGVSVDEFQHFVYENPDATPAERKAAWRDIERKYLPHRNYEGIDYLERGGFWHKQGHIFQMPFYYIDYTLAQICAFQFWKRMNEDYKAAWADYLKLCQTGGSQSFTGLVAVAGLISPFEDGCVASVIGVIEQWLNEVDDTKL